MKSSEGGARFKHLTGLQCVSLDSEGQTKPHNTLVITFLFTEVTSSRLLFSESRSESKKQCYRNDSHAIAEARALSWPDVFASRPLLPAHRQVRHGTHAAFNGRFSHLSTREKKLASGVPASGSTGRPPRFAGEPQRRLGSHICRPVKNSWQSSCLSARQKSA